MKTKYFVIRHNSNKYVAYHRGDYAVAPEDFSLVKDITDATVYTTKQVKDFYLMLKDMGKNVSKFAHIEVYTMTVRIALVEAK